MANYEIALSALPAVIRRGRALRVLGTVQALGQDLPRLWRDRHPLKLAVELRAGPDRRLVNAARFAVETEDGLLAGVPFNFDCLLGTANCPPGEAILQIDLVYEKFAWLRDRGGRALTTPLTIMPSGQFPEIDLPEIDIQADSEFEIRRGELRFDCQLDIQPGSSRLIVPLRGYAKRPEDPPPGFLAWPDGFAGQANILRISDPTLFLSDQLQLGSFLGREHADPIDGVVEITAAIAARLKVKPENVLFFGMSGGGMAALMCAMRLKSSAALSCNAQIDARRFATASFTRVIGDIFRPGADLNWVIDNYPRRVSVIAATSAVMEAGYVPRLTLLQNVSDDRHYNEHFGAFCRAFGIPPSGGMDATGRLRAIAYDKPGGHPAMPDDEQVVSEALQLLGASSGDNGGPTRT